MKPRATYRDHGKGQAELQHNAALLSSDRFVHQTHVVTGSAPDPTTLMPLLEKLHQHQGFFPPTLFSAPEGVKSPATKSTAAAKPGPRWPPSARARPN